MTPITTLALDCDIHELLSFTEKVYLVLVDKPLMVVLGVLPVAFKPAGLLVITQLPIGKPLNSTLPIALHLG